MNRDQFEFKLREIALNEDLDGKAMAEAIKPVVREFYESNHEE